MTVPARLLAPAASAFALLGAAAPVGYTPPPSDPRAIQVMAGYAECVAGRDPAGARRVLAYEPDGDSGDNRRLRDFALSHRQCLMGGQLKFQGMIFAGDMAETLMKRDRVTAQMLGDASAGGESPVMARCVVAKRPEEMLRLFATGHASREEAEVLSGLRETLAGCTRRGATLTTNLVGLRARLALASYRLLNNPASAPAGN